MREREFYTTNQIAKLIGVTQMTVINWIKGSKLEAFRTIGGHRRITKKAVWEFCKTHSLPVPEELQHFANEIKSDKKVLLVDDDPEVINNLREFLEESGYIVKHASNGFTAGYALGEWIPDMILMDIRTAGIDGYNIARTIKDMDTTKTTKLIACTSIPDSDTADRIKENRFDDFVAKPLNLDELRKKMDHHLPVEHFFYKAR